MWRRLPLLAALAAIWIALALPAAASAELGDPASQRPFGSEPEPALVEAEPATKPPGFRLDGATAILLAGETEPVRDELAENPARPMPFVLGKRCWRISYLDRDGTEVAQVTIDGRTGEVIEAWRDQQVEVRLARGYEDAVAGQVSEAWVFLPLCVLFLAPFIDPRRPFRLLHLDLLVLLSFAVSHLFFNQGEIVVSVPLVYPVLAYLLVRLLIAGIWPRTRGGPLVPYARARWLAVGIVALVLARGGLAIADDNVIDIGFAGIVGADRISEGREIYDGSFSPLIDRGDSYGPLNYIAYVPFEQAFPWERGTADGLTGAKLASLAFDLLVIAALWALGRRMRPGGEGRLLGLALAFAWAAYPYSAYTLVGDANDALVAAAVLGALLTLGSSLGRGAMVALGTAVKFGPLALAPLLAAGRGGSRWRSAVPFMFAFAVVTALAFAPFVPDGGLSELYDRTFGYQASRGSPFSIWGLDPSLETVQSVVRGAAVALGLALFFVPRTRTTPQLAALAGAALVATQLGAEHWFYFSIAWFAPLALVALFAEHREVGRDPRPPA